MLIQEFGSFPYLFRIELSEFREYEASLTEYACEQFNAKLDRNLGNSIELDRTPVLERLWNVFHDVCNRYFVNLQQAENNPRHGAIWCYVQNKESFSDVWHNHIRTASINGVYYPSVPDPTGRLSVIATHGKMFKVDVQQGWMYLFPGWLIHKPDPQQNSLAPRVSINVELLTLTRPLLRLSEFDQSEIRTTDPMARPDVLW